MCDAPEHHHGKAEATKALDVAGLPSRWGVKLGVVLIRGYQLFLSPLLGAHCRFEPTCSSYAREALEVHGLARGIWLAARRILRCRPGGGFGYDPVPPKEAGHGSS
ncbi:MAG: membrane protein insertion efficiency factor YidD [Myxococcota bacterium]